MSRGAEADRRIFDYSLTPPVREILEHYHPYPPHLANYNRIYQRSTEQSETAQFADRPFAEFVRFLDQQGVGRFVVKARDIETTFGLRIPNEAVAELVRQYPDRIVGVAGADPHKGMRAVRDLEHAVRHLGLRGLNLQCYELKLPPNDKKIYPLYAKCVELDIAVNIHVSANFSTQIPLSYGHPLALDEVAVDFPELRIIASPPGWPWIHELVAVAWRHPNVYIGLSSVRPAILGKAGSGYEPLLTYGNSVLQDKLIFGSGWPLLPMRRSLAEMRALPWRTAVLPKIMGDNAARALGVSG
jgi:predicted TIM-barrel fold metal-dependent hydrolase